MNPEILINITPLHWEEIATALICGAIIGLERQLRGKPVGIRTSTLITLGTYVFIAAAAFISSESADPSRIIGQVVTGIGFLGAGVMLARDGVVVGVTSAATIWSLAAVGVCVAIGETLTAIKLSIIIVGILVGVDLLEQYSQALTRGVHRRLSYWRDGRSDTRESEGNE
jgi:putative Mg2+ transporter-C (MgtC) family protein